MLKCPKTHRKMVRILPKTISHKEFLLIINSVSLKDKKKERKIKASFALGFYLCLRVSEVSFLKPADIDRERGFIHILSGKGKKDRDIPIQKPLERFLKYIPVGYSTRHLNRLFKERAKEVLGRDLHFHILRHSGATFYLNDLGMDIRHVQIFLGHANLQTTTIYTHVTPSALKDITDKLWEGL